MIVRYMSRHVITSTTLIFEIKSKIMFFAIDFSISSHSARSNAEESGVQCDNRGTEVPGSEPLVLRWSEKTFCEKNVLRPFLCFPVLKGNKIDHL